MLDDANNTVLMKTMQLLEDGLQPHSILLTLILLYVCEYHKWYQLEPFFLKIFKSLKHFNKHHLFQAIVKPLTTLKMVR